MYDIYKPGQTVRVVRTVAIAFDVTISDYLEDSGDTDIDAGTLLSDIEGQSVEETLDEFECEQTDISVEIVDVN
jgi:hypothetical protein